MQQDHGLLPGTRSSVLSDLCSALSARRGLPLIGSAGFYDSIVAFEIPGPWTPRIVGSRASDAALDDVLVRVAAGRPLLRLLAMEPYEAARDSATVLFFSRSDGAFRRFARREFRICREELAATIEALAFGGAVGGEIGGSEDVRDVLVCTHGTRDACCGKFGFPIYRELTRLVSESGEQRVRIRRSSHLGGHRFAPTLLDLPSGRIFGRLTESDARLVLDGGQPLVERLPAIYRGCCALPEPAQLVERMLWTGTGPAFDGAERSWSVEADGGRWRVSMRFEGFGRSGESGDVRVIRDSAAAIETPASCGRDPESEAPWSVVESGSNAK